jgi:hypothetical protein
MKLDRKDLYISSAGYSTERAFVVGSMFGPMLLAVGGTLHEAADEFAIRYNEPVEPDDPALADYPNGFVGALNEGAAEWTDEGPRWADIYQWAREFRGPDAVRRAGEFFRKWRG